MTLPWQQIDTVLLDLDGTLLDLYFDNYFWLEHLPKRMAESKQETEEAIKHQLLLHMREIEGTLDWYCLDYWSTLLELDIAALKQEIADRVTIHPGVVEFLSAIRERDKKVVLVTNGHRKGLEIKLRQTGLTDHFDEIVSSHDYGVEKEQITFWKALNKAHPFDPAKAVLVDDNLSVLNSAKEYGVAYLVAPSQPDSRQPIRAIEGFMSIRGFVDIMPS